MITVIQAKPSRNPLTYPQTRHLQSLTRLQLSNIRRHLLVAHERFEKPQHLRLLHFVLSLQLRKNTPQRMSRSTQKALQLLLLNGFDKIILHHITIAIFWNTDDQISKQYIDLIAGHTSAYTEQEAEANVR